MSLTLIILCVEIFLTARGESARVETHNYHRVTATKMKSNNKRIMMEEVQICLNPVNRLLAQLDYIDQPAICARNVELSFSYAGNNKCQGIPIYESRLVKKLVPRIF